MMLDLDKIKDLYDKNLDQHGIDSKSVGWTTPDSQVLRFEKLSSMVKDRTEPFTLNELGCGYGELYKYLLANGYNLKEYIGYDISDKMLEAAKTYIPYDNVKLLNAPKVTEMADYTTTSGIFNVKFEHEMEQWEDYIKACLKNMFEHSNKAMSFNLLTTYVDFEAENLYYADPTYFFNFCKRELSRYVTLIHDYKLYEWTIVVSK